MSKIAKMVDHRVRLALLALVMTAAMTIGITASAGAAVAITTSTSITVGTSVSGTLSGTTGDSLVDGTRTRYFIAYRVPLSAATTYVIRLNDTGSGAGIYPVLYLLDSSKEIIGYCDKGVSPAPWNPRMVFTPTTSGTYYLLASSWSGDVTGPFSLSVMQEGMISGTVTNSSGQALVGVSVSAYIKQYSAYLDVGISTQTDSNGNYTLGGLDAGTYRVKFKDESGAYAPQCYNSKPTIDTATDVVVAAGQTALLVNAKLVTAGKISGTVTNSSDQVLSGIYVAAYEKNAVSGVYDLVSDAYTDPNGNYTLGGLNTGTYRVMFQDGSGIYPAQYYDNKPTLSTSTDVVVTSAQVTQMINAQLVAPGKISGTVTNTSGQPLSGIYVDVYMSYSGGWWGYAGYSTTTDLNGNYTLSGLAPGVYRVGFDSGNGTYVTQYYDNKPTVDTATDVVVVDGQNTTTVNARMVAAGYITGTVTNSSGQGIDYMRLIAYRYNTDSGMWEMAYQGGTTPTGDYFIPGLAAGTYRVACVDAHTGIYATQYYNNKDTVEGGTDVAVAAGKTTPDINFKLLLLSEIVDPCTISYNANGGTGAPAAQTKTYGVTLHLSTTKPTRTGYSFLGWSTSKTATTATYQPGDIYGAYTAVTLYAVWRADTYTVSYDANGGTGAPAAQTKTYGVTLLLSTTVPTRAGYTFLGWSTSKTATTATYLSGANYTANAAATLYAVWKVIPPTITRMGGADRYETAVKIAKQGWPSGASTVLLASGANYPDALAATPLAAMKNAPILLTTTASTPAVTMTEIKVLKPKSIILLGGTGVISAAQATALKNAGYNVTRYGGADRYATAQLISNAVEALGGSKTAILVTGVNYPDALIMGPVAGMNKMPIIFSTPTGLPAQTKTFITANKITKIITVGYTAGNATIMSQAKSAVGTANVTAIAGTDGYVTSVAVANKYKSSFANGVAVATGANFPDALTGGALAAKMKFPVLLINPTSGASAGAKTYVKALPAPAIYVYGGTGVLTDAIVQGLYK